MRVCFICVEIFAWGKYGGFGRATRTIGRELVKRGVEVFAIVPRRKGQKPVEELDGIKVFSFQPYRPLSSRKLYRDCDADIYHSQEPSFSTYLAMKAMPDRKHIITMRDPKFIEDWKMEFQFPSLNKVQVLLNYFYEDGFFVKRAVRGADRVFCASNHLVPKLKYKYGLKSNPRFLPTPIALPEKVKKAINPTVCFISRFDRRKRPEVFFELTKKFPHVGFIAMGESRDRKWDNFLRRKYSNLPNLEIKGFIDQFSSNTHAKILEESWILVNTASREGLPISFLEAAANRCAILSVVDPDGFVSNFGYCVKDDDFAKGLEFLLGDERWKERGNFGYEYIKKTFELNRTIDQHIEVYEHLLGD